MATWMRRNLKIEFCHESWNSNIPMELNFNQPDMTPQEISQHEYFNTLFDSEGEKYSNYQILVGLNASGKTTLLKLLKDFYSSFHRKNKIEKNDFMTKWADKGVTYFKSTMGYELKSGGIEAFEDFEIDYPETWKVVDIVSDKAFELFCWLVKNSISSPAEDLLDTADGLWDENFDVLITKTEFVKRMQDDNDEFGDFVEDLLGDHAVQHAEASTIFIELTDELNMKDREYNLSADIWFADIYCMHGVNRNFVRDFSINLSDTNDRIDFNDLIQQTFLKINEEFVPRLYSSKLYGYPNFQNITYISSNEISEAPPASEKLIMCMEEFDAIEDKLHDEPMKNIFDLFDVQNYGSDMIFDRDGGKKIHSFETIDFDERAGSEENLGKLTDYETRVKNELKIPLYQAKGSVDGWERDWEIVRISNDQPPFPNGYFWLGYRGCDPQIKICNIGTHEYSQGGDVIRFFGDVIVLPDGQIYSTNMYSLHEFLKREVWRICSDSKKRELLSKVFDVKLEEVNAYKAVQDLLEESTLKNYLSSGQQRIFSIIKKSSASDSEILLIDEPEVSLHIDWQRKIIDLIRKYSKAKIILIATHSPDVIYHHLDKVIELNSKIED